MVRSMFAAVAGLKTHQSKMDVIGNNIANVNTYGYKRERAVFSDTFYATNQAAANPTAVKGGLNPTQVGYGVQVANVNMITTTGGTAMTDNPTDVMITGNGYFVVGDYNKDGYTNSSDASGTDEMGSITDLWMTRVGLFNFDGSGSFVDGNAHYVYGHSSIRGTAVQSAASTDGQPAGQWAFNIGGGSGDAATLEARYIVRSITAKDGLVTGYEVYKLPSTATDKDWLTVTDGTVTEPAGSTLVMKLHADDFNPMTATTLYVLPTTGDYSDYVTYTVDQKTGYVKNLGTGEVQTDDSHLSTIQIPRQYTLNGYYDKNGKPVVVTLYDENDSLRLNVYTMNNLGELSANPETITVTGEEYWDASKAIELSSISVGENGSISGTYNGVVMSLGKIAVANVPNSVALEGQGNGYYKARANTGVIEAFHPGEGSTGALAGGILEMSNVDLSTEFTDMITCQRGYQANSRIITVTDTMLEELVNLKRS